MSDIINKESILKEINNLSFNNLVVINMPVEVFAREARTLYLYAKDDMHKFISAGFNPSAINKLLPLSEILMDAESEWQKVSSNDSEHRKDWKTLHPKAVEFRNELIHKLKYAFRNTPDIIRLLIKIKKHSTYSELSQDLNDLAVLCNSDIDALKSINFDMSLIDRARDMSKEVASVLASHNTDKKKVNESKLHRDKIYTYLKHLVKEVRVCAKYLFHKDEEKLKCYRSDHFHKKYIARRNRIKEQ